MTATKETLIGAGVTHLAADELGEDVATGLSATGSVIGDAYAISAEVSRFETVALNTGAILPGANVGKTYYVKNDGANALDVYPHDASGVINGLSAGAPAIVAAGELAICKRLSQTNWIVAIAVAP